MAYTPDRAYRTAVVPLSVFFVAGGAILLVVFSLGLVPITAPCPFVESKIANRIVFVVLSLATIAFGVGLYLKSRAAWLGMLAYVVVGTLALLFGVMLDPRYAESRAGYALAAPINVVFAVGAYFATAPAFRPGEDEDDPNQSVERPSETD